MESSVRQPNTYLSKSLYIKGLQCPKALWLHKYRPELKDEVPASREVIFASGTDVGILAQQLFPGGVEVPYEGLAPAEQVTRTQELIDAGTTVIYEATFSFDGLFVKVDILQRGDHGWELYEVKSSSRLKDIHLDDIAVQYHALAGAGIAASKASLVHIDTGYVRQGEIDVHRLFRIVDVTAEILSRQDEVARNLADLRSMLTGDDPETGIGPHCRDPYDCSFLGHCWQHVPEDSVFDFRDVGRPDVWNLYRQGILRMADVPREALGWRQQLQQDGLLHRKNRIDTDKLLEFLDSLWYPLCFMDFETCYGEPIPLFDGTRPYQQVPFQFSLHLLDGPGAELRHLEFLADGHNDPREEFLAELLAAIPENACVLAWNQTFEMTRLKELAVAFPQQGRRVQSVLDAVRDLMQPFRAKDIYHWQFDGSYSIKSVLPALIPELSYDNLTVSNGEMASAAWLRTIRTDVPGERQELRQALLDYCRLDTLAMVRIWEEMHRLRRNGDFR